jgi:MFS family permease
MAKIAVMMNIFLTGIVAITMPFMINTDLGLEPIVLASAMVSMSLGGMIMAMKLSKEEITNAGRRLGIGFLVGVISFALVTVNYYLISTGVYSGLVFLGFLVIIFLVFGASGSFIQIPLNVSYASRVDKEVMGRVMAFRSTLSTIASPVAMVVFGFIIDYTNVLTAMIFGTLGMLLVTIYTYQNEHIKAL